MRRIAISLVPFILMLLASLLIGRAVRGAEPLPPGLVDASGYTDGEPVDAFTPYTVP